MSLDRSLGMLFFICFLPLIPQGSFGRVSSAQSLAVSYPLVSRKGVIREAVSAFEPAAAPVETRFDKLQETAWFLDEFSCCHFWAGRFLFDPDWKWHDLGPCGWSAGARHAGYLDLFG